MLTAKRGWCVLAVSVLLYEVLCPEGELLSEGVDRAMVHHPVFVRFLILVVAAHLVNWLPRFVDPLHGLSVLVSRWRGVPRDRLEVVVFE